MGRGYLEHVDTSEDFRVCQSGPLSYLYTNIRNYIIWDGCNFLLTNCVFYRPDCDYRIILKNLTNSTSSPYWLSKVFIDILKYMWDSHSFIQHKDTLGSKLF